MWWMKLRTTISNGTQKFKDMNWNRIIMFTLAGGLIGGFLYVGEVERAGDLATVLFGALVVKAGVQNKHGQ